MRCSARSAAARRTRNSSSVSSAINPASPSRPARRRASRCAWISTRGSGCEGKRSSCSAAKRASRFVYCRGATISTGRDAMNGFNQIGHVLSRWLDTVAAWIVAAYAKAVAAPGVRVVEERDGTFAVQASGKTAAAPERLRIVNGEVVATGAGNAAAMLKASRAELVLQPERFVFRPLELPRRATEFLEGIVRAQIDRLTPWSAENAAFGWSAPVEIANDRVLVTIAATARSLVMPLVTALAGLGARH